MQGPKIIITGEDRFSQTMENVKKKTLSMGASLSNITNTITNRFLLPAAAALAGTAKVGMDIGQAFNRISYLTDQSGEKLKEYKKKVLDLASSDLSTFRPLEISKAMGDIIQAGFDKDSALVMLPSIMKTAQVAETTLANATLGLTDAMSQFNLDASQGKSILNSYTVASNMTKASFDSLREGMKNAGSVGAAFGMTLNRTLAVIAHMQQKGILPAESGTAFKSMELAMTAPMGNAVEIWRQAKEKFNITPRDIAGNLRNPLLVIEELSKAFEKAGMGTAARGTVLKELFGSYASVAVMGFINDISNGASLLTDKIEAEMVRQSDLLDNGAKILASGGKSAFIQAWSELETQLSTLYDKSLEERLVRIFKNFEGIAKAVGNIDKSKIDLLINMFVSIGALTISLGALGRILTMLGNIVNIGKFLGLTFGMGPAGAIAAGIGLIVLAALELADAWDRVKKGLPEVDPMTGKVYVFQSILEGIREGWTGIANETSRANLEKERYMAGIKDERIKERSWAAKVQMEEAIASSRGVMASYAWAAKGIAKSGANLLSDMLIGSDYAKATNASPSLNTIPTALRNVTAPTLFPGILRANQNVQERVAQQKPYEAHIIFDNAPAGTKLRETKAPSGLFNFLPSLNTGIPMGTP